MEVPRQKMVFRVLRHECFDMCRGHHRSVVTRRCRMESINVWNQRVEVKSERSIRKRERERDEETC